jgi:hypothetical protein
VTCRLDNRTLNALDMLVEAGVRSTRSDAAGWLISAGVESHSALFECVRATVSEIRRLRVEAQNLAQQAISELGQPPAPDELNTKHSGSELQPPEYSHLKTKHHLNDSRRQDKRLSRSSL